MKIDSIDLFCFNPDIVTPKFVANFNFKDYTAQNPYKVKAIEGLDAEEISTKFYGYTSVSNRKSYSMSPGKRHIVMSIELNPDYAAGETVSSLRDDLYRSISSSRTGDVYLVFKKDSVGIAYIDGNIIKLESSNFEAVPEIQLTIACQESMLRSYNEIAVDVSTFSIDDVATITDNTSTAPHGFKFEVGFSGPASKFIVEEPVLLDWEFAVEPRFITPAIDGFIVGDTLGFSSIVGARELYIVRNGVRYNIVDKISPTSFWPMIFPGGNSYHINSTNYYWKWIRYYHSFWGI